PTSTAKASVGPPLLHSSSEYCSAALGGCASTYRESATTPCVLSCLTWAQVTGPGVVTSHRESIGLPGSLAACSAAGGRAPGRSTITLARRLLGSSTVATPRNDWPPVSRMVSPTPVPSRLAARGVSATSSAAAGVRPDSG